MIAGVHWRPTKGGLAMADGDQIEFTRDIWLADEHPLEVRHRDRQAFDRENAIRDLTKALDIDRSNFANYKLRGRLLLDKSDYPRARRDYERAIELEPEDAESLFFLGVVHREMGQYDEAIRSFNSSLELNPSIAPLVEEVHYFRGLTYKEVGELKKALEDFRWLLDLDPCDDEALSLREEVCAALRGTLPTSQ